MKVFNTCNIENNISFSKRSANKGLNNTCRECVKVKMSEVDGE